MTVNRQGAADLFGVALTTVDGWRRRGCPVVQRGSAGVEWQFNTADLHKWLCDQQVAMATGDTPEDEKNLARRKAVAQTELVELELAKAKAEVIDVSLAERALSAAFSTLQVQLRNLPAAVVTSLIGETDETRFKEVLLARIDRALEELASLDLTGLPEDEAEEDDELDDEADE